MLAPRSITNFALEWTGLAAIALVNVIWALAIDFHLIVGLIDFMLVSAVLVLLIAARKMRAERAAFVLEFFCLSLGATAAFGVFSYLAMASAYGPLMDAPFLAADRALGFDWPAFYHWVIARPLVAWPLKLLYASIVIQALIAGITLGWRGERQRMRELFRIIFVSSFLTCIVAMLLPALGPFKIFQIPGSGVFLPDMEHLLTHQDLTFKLSELNGVVSFPSFHVVVALAYAWALRHAGRVGQAMVVLNIGMLPSIPVFGGHYLVDAIAGAVTMLVSLAIVKIAPVLKNRIADAAGQAPASASAGA